MLVIEVTVRMVLTPVKAVEVLVLVVVDVLVKVTVGVKLVLVLVTTIVVVVSKMLELTIGVTRGVKFAIPIAVKRNSINSIEVFLRILSTLLTDNYDDRY